MRVQWFAMAPITPPGASMGSFQKLALRLARVVAMMRFAIGSARLNSARGRLVARIDACPGFVRCGFVRTTVQAKYLEGDTESAGAEQG